MTAVVDRMGPGNPGMRGLAARLTTAAFALLAALLALILASLFRIDFVPWPIPLALAAFAVFAAWRPDQALLVVAAVTPLASYVGHRLNYQVAWAEAVVVAFAAGWAVRGLRARREPPIAAWLLLPTGMFALIVAASVGVGLSVEQMRLGTTGVVGRLWRYFSLEYFVSGPDQYLHAGAALLQGLLLLSAAARAAAADAAAAGRMARVLAASTAIAALLNLEALVDSARRSAPFWTMLAQHIRTTRINVHYGDVNAAGSHFAMVLFVAAGLACGRRGKGWIAAVAALGLGLWMSGSRAALFACPLAVAIGAALTAQARGGRRTRIAAAVAATGLAAAAVLLLAYAPIRANQTSSSIAALVRVEMARATWKMLEEHPAFGIGMGQFYQRSGDYSSPALVAAFPRAVHENAHNNFLQILAETGLTGFAVFVWLLAAAMYAGWTYARLSKGMIAWGCLTGLTAFLLTWLAGHPLLTREPAYAFWMLLGTAAGPAVIVVSATPSIPRTRWSRQAILATAILIAISWPFRAVSARAQADLEHLGIGLSPHWETADDGVRYRSAVNAASIFVPAETGFRFQVRALSPMTERLELRLGGRLADIVALPPGRWTTVTMAPRNDRTESRYSVVEVRLVEPDARTVTLWIAKVEPLGP